MWLKSFKTYRRERWVLVVLGMIVMIWVVVFFVKHRVSDSDHTLQELSVAAQPPVVIDLHMGADSIEASKPISKETQKARQTHKPHQKAAATVNQRDHLNESAE